MEATMTGSDEVKDGASEKGIEPKQPATDNLSDEQLSKVVGGVKPIPVKKSGDPCDGGN
jgi:hypothetical protein